jgi:hypothetical protein
MTYYQKAHPPIYYTVRTIVRFMFWTAVLFGLLFAVTKANGENNECDVVVTQSFSWRWADDAKVRDLDKCSDPANTVLNEDGTFIWKQ